MVNMVVTRVILVEAALVVYNVGEVSKMVNMVVTCVILVEAALVLYNVETKTLITRLYHVSGNIHTFHWHFLISANPSSVPFCKKRRLG